MVSVTVVSFSVFSVFDLSTNSLLDVEDENTGGFSDELVLAGVSFGTQLHDPCLNLSSLLHSAAILRLILLPQKDPVEEGLEDGP